MTAQRHAESARRMWKLFEPIHAVTYFSDESAAAARAVGYRGFWMGYFAFRLSPVGPVGPGAATAVCFGFDRSRVERALPDAWNFAGPAQALSARLDGVTAALARMFAVFRFGSDRAAFDTDLAEAADLAWSAAQHAETSGRVLAAANQSLPRPDDPLGVLWQAATTLREHRGDGHNAALIVAGLIPVQAHWIKIAATETDPQMLRSSRNWSDQSWAAGRRDLQRRGWLAANGRLSDAGQVVHHAVEAETDTAAVTPWAHLGPQATDRLAALLAPLSTAVIHAGAVPFPNPIGLTRGLDTATE